ncbi:hypothetical protein CBM2606_A100007 [Cupriavidus taiwanensis]|nr:hypothetical protein CBM2606_A100007 [Cupriavidus taiwanensis]
MREISPLGPSSNSRRTSRLTCRALMPKRSAARQRAKCPSATAWITFIRSTSRMLMVTKSRSCMAASRSARRNSQRTGTQAQVTSLTMAKVTLLKTANTYISHNVYYVKYDIVSTSRFIRAPRTLLEQNASPQSHSFRAPAHIGSLPAPLS